MNTERQQTIAELRTKIHRHEHHFQEAVDTVSTGSEILDRLFPGQGVRRGSVVEWISRKETGGAGTLSLWVAHHLLEKHRPAIVIDSQKQIYPLPFLALGDHPAALIFVRPNGDGESLWAMEQALRCEAVSMVWGIAPHLTPVAFRRLKLAAEQSGSVGFFLRSREALRQPTWADARLLVEPRPSPGESPRFHVQVASSRGQGMQSSVDVQIDGMSGLICGVSDAHETPVVSLVS